MGLGAVAGLAILPAGRELPPKRIKRLVWWAEHEFRKLKTLPEGGTLADAFASYRRQVGKPHPEDREHVTPPEEMLHVWEWFWQLNQGRPFGPEGMQLPLPSTEIRAWADLAEIRPLAWELVAIRALDGAYLRVSTDKSI